MAYKTSPYHMGEFQTHVFHVAPSVGPTVSVVNVQGRQTHTQKADQLTKPGNGTVCA